MNNQEQRAPSSAELPAPIPNEKIEPASQVDTNSEKAASQHLEQGLSFTEPSAKGVSRQNDQITNPIAPQSVATSDTQAPDTTQSLGVTIADDNDLIEKEWIDKAKRIVEQTRHDPHLQNREMNNMKADYIKKRYNKDVKLSE